MRHPSSNSLNYERVHLQLFRIYLWAILWRTNRRTPTTLNNLPICYFNAIIPFEVLRLYTYLGTANHPKNIPCFLTTSNYCPTHTRSFYYLRNRGKRGNVSVSPLTKTLCGNWHSFRRLSFKNTMYTLSKKHIVTAYINIAPLGNPTYPSLSFSSRTLFAGKSWTCSVLPYFGISTLSPADCPISSSLHIPSRLLFQVWS